MSERTLARRYAEGILDVAVERDVVREVEEELNWVGEFFEDDPYLQQIIKNPLIKKEEKQQILSDSFQDRLREETVNLLELLLEKGRLTMLPELAEAYDDLADDYHGVVKIEVESAQELSDDVIGKLTEELERLLGGQEVELSTSIEPDLLAGMRIRIGDDVLDGSLSGRLENLNNALQSRIEI